VERAPPGHVNDAGLQSPDLPLQDDVGTVLLASSYPLLSDRWNVVVLADEAHRSQYDFIDGFARHLRDALPNASFIGFMGTPIELADKNTRAALGDYISVYDIQRGRRGRGYRPNPR
jgi:type I site-specific restriction-modification system R (restriction) subunit